MSVFIVESYHYGGIDWHDTSSTREFIPHKDDVNNYFYSTQEEAIKAATEKMLDELRANEELAAFDESKVLDVLNGTLDKYVIRYKDSVDDGEYPNNSIEITKGTKAKCAQNEIALPITIEYVYWHGQATYTQVYYIAEHDEKDIVFFVVENFPCPTKGCWNVERMYHDVFDNVNDALEFLEKMPLHEIETSHSRKELCIAKRNSFLETEFYKKQMEALRLVNEKNSDIYGPHFRLFVDAHIKELSNL